MFEAFRSRAGARGEDSLLAVTVGKAGRVVGVEPAGLRGFIVLVLVLADSSGFVLVNGIVHGNLNAPSTKISTNPAGEQEHLNRRRVVAPTPACPQCLVPAPRDDIRIP